MRFRELRIEASKLISDHGVVAPNLVFRSTAHHVRMIFAGLLPKDYTLDGSSVVQLTYGPRGNERQYYQALGSSEYFVEDFAFERYAQASPSQRQEMLLASIESALCDIAQRSGADGTPIHNAAASVVECHFEQETEITKLRKTLRPSGCVVRVFRCLSSPLGETWMLRVVNRAEITVAEKVMGNTPDYLDRRDFFKSASLADCCYVTQDRLGKETFRLDVAQWENES